MLEEAENAEQSVSELSAVPRGELRVTAPLTIGQAMLTPLAKQFTDEYPQVKLRFFLSNRVVQLIDENFDIALRLGRLEDSSLLARKLGTTQRRLYASPEYLKANGRPRRPQDLARHSCMGAAETQLVETWALLRGKETQTIEVSPRIVVNDTSRCARSQQAAPESPLSRSIYSTRRASSGFFRNGHSHRWT